MCKGFILFGEGFVWLDSRVCWINHAAQGFVGVIIGLLFGWNGTSINLDHDRPVGGTALEKRLSSAGPIAMDHMIRAFGGFQLPPRCPQKGVPKADVSFHDIDQVFGRWWKDGREPIDPLGTVIHEPCHE